MNMVSFARPFGEGLSSLNGKRCGNMEKAKSNLRRNFDRHNTNIGFTQTISRVRLRVVDMQARSFMCMRKDAFQP